MAVIQKMIIYLIKTRSISCTFSTTPDIISISLCSESTFTLLRRFSLMLLCKTLHMSTDYKTILLSNLSSSLYLLLKLQMDNKQAIIKGINKLFWVPSTPVILGHPYIAEWWRCQVEHPQHIALELMFNF